LHVWSRSPEPARGLGSLDVGAARLGLAEEWETVAARVA